MNTSVLLSIIGCGGVAVITILIQKIFSGDLSFLDKYIKDNAKEKIEKSVSEKGYTEPIEKKKEVEQKEKQAEKKEEYIKDVVKKESKKIEKSKKETNISVIDNEIDNSWDEL